MQRTSLWWAAGMAVSLLAAACTGDTPPSVTSPDIPPPSLAPPTSYPTSWNLTAGSPRTINGALWQYPVPFNVGTGLINPFLSVQDAGDEEGFNTDGAFNYQQTRSNFTNPLPLNQVPVIKEGGSLWREFIFDANEANSTPDAYFSIDKLDFWVCSGTAAKTYENVSDFAGAGAPCVKVYYIEPVTDGGVTYVRGLATDAATSGSGQALDYRILIPDANFVAPAGGGAISSLCPYNPSAADCGYYLIVHAKMGYFGTVAGGDPDYVTGSTFEEFSTIKRGYVQVSKTATTTFTRTYNWTIDKSVTPTTINLWNGDNQNASYSVLVTNTGSTDGSWAVSGNITINNPSSLDVIIASLPTDVMTGGLAATVNCGTAVFPYTLAGKSTLNCTYSRALPDGTSRTNTVTVELQDLAVSTATAAVTFGAPTTEVNKTVNITDLYPNPGGSTTALGTVTAGVNSPRTFSYTRNYACGADKGTKNNRATIVETGQYDDASVIVNCYNLTVSKTAVPARATTYVWTIDKKVKKQADADGAYAASKTFALITGDEGVATYRVVLDRTVTADVFSVTGVITITNPSTSSGAVVVRNVTDAILSPALSATITSCSGGTPSGTIPNGSSANYVSLAANSSMTCNYTATFGSNPGTGTLTNRATAVGAIPTDNTKSFTGDQTFSFSGVTPTVTGSASVTLTDPNDPSSPRGPYSDDVTVTYDKTFTCTNAGTNNNTASINTSPAQTSSAAVTITCTAPVVTKTATTSLTKTWDWTIVKAAGDNPGAPLVDGKLTLALNQSYIFNYKVTVDVKSGYPVTSEWKTKGTITVTNPAGQSVKLNSITDAVAPGGFSPAVSDCKLNGAGTAVTFPYVLAASANLQCVWAETAMPNGDTRTNTATAVKQHRRWTADATVTDIAASTANYTGTASVNFAGATVKKVDNCVKVTDPQAPSGGVLGTVCESAQAGAFTPPKDFLYSIQIGPYAVCGPYNFPNTASFTSAVVSTNATPVTGSSTFNVPVDIPCENGCTLTQGYWKTHNALFGIKKDGSRKGPPIHVFDPNTAWNDYAYWKFFGGTPNPVPPGVTAVPLPPKAAPTWYTTWVTPPKGDPYYTAAHQFMAALANKGNGASTTAINSELTAAWNFFINPVNVPGTPWTDEQRGWLLGWNSTFGSYNEGLIGPGHCDEDGTSAP